MLSPIVTIIGNGFGGVYTARALLKHGVSVRLIGTEEYFTFMPLLHEVATGTLCDSDVRFPIRSFLTNNNKLEIISSQAAVTDFDSKKIILKNGSVVDYEYLVIATGARPRFDIVKGAEAFSL
jgi:NADH dehydrogenase FAD-containing subunit